MREIENGVTYETFYGKENELSLKVATQARSTMELGVSEMLGVDTSDIKCIGGSAEEWKQAIEEGEMAAMLATRDEVVGVLVVRPVSGESLGLLGSDDRNPVREIFLSIDPYARREKIAKTLFNLFLVACIDPEIRDDVGNIPGEVKKESVTAVIQMPANGVPDWQQQQLQKAGFSSIGNKPNNSSIEVWKNQYRRLAESPQGEIDALGHYNRHGF